METVVATPERPNIPGFEILEQAGRGGMATVYRARQIELNRIVALKLMSRVGFAEDEMRTRFEREARAVAQLQHPNIAQLYEVGMHGGQPYLALEYLSGGTLATLNQDPLAPKDAAKLLAILARAVGHSHDQGVVHRDLKPGNILLDEHGNPKLVDFGLAKFVNHAADLTRTGAVLGTPSYMAPEQASGAVKNIGPACDIYALGTILYQLLVGRPPFLTDDVTETILLVLTEDPVPPRRLQPRIPKDLETICLKCLEKTPNRRYETALNLADDLERFCEGRTIRARRASGFEKTVRWARRKPTAAASLAFSLVMLVTLFVGSIVYSGKLSASNQQLREERDRSDRLFQSGQDLAQWTLFEHVDRIRELHGSTDTQLELAKEMRVYLDRLASESEGDLELAEVVARSYERLAEIQGDPSLPNIGHSKDALENYQAALQLHKRIVENQPSNVGARFNYVACLSSIGLIQAQLGESKKAESSYADALEMLDRSYSADDQAAFAELLRSNIQVRLGDLDRDNLKLADAETHYLRALEHGEATASEATQGVFTTDMVVRCRLVALYVQSYRHSGDPEALANAEFYGAIVANPFSNISELEDLDALTCREVVQALGVYAELLAETTSTDEAIATLQQLVVVTKMMSDLDPENVTRRRDAGVQLTQLGIAHQNAGQHDEAIQCFLESLEISEQLAHWKEDDIEATRDLWYDLCEVGSAYMTVYRLEEARPYLERTVEVSEELATDNKADLIRKAQSYERWGILLHEIGKRETDDASRRQNLTEAKTSMNQSIAFLDQVIEKSWSTREYKDSIQDLQLKIEQINEAMQDDEMN